MRPARSLLGLLLALPACVSQPIPIDNPHPPDLAIAPDLAKLDDSDLGQAKDAPCDMAKLPSDLARPADLAPGPDLTPPPDLSPPPDLTRPPDLSPPPDLVACGAPAQPCCGGNMCQGNGFACYDDQICRQCGDAGQKPCGFNCNMGLHPLVEGDFCNMQKPRICVLPINCGGGTLPPCDDRGQVSQFGNCIVGLRKGFKPGVGNICVACYP